MTLVMSVEDRRTYTCERKLFREDERRARQLEDLSGIIIHNAYTTAEVESSLRTAGVMAEKYVPRKSTETHFYDARQGIIHPVNTRGEIRLLRDKDLSVSLEELLSRNLSVQIDHYGGDEARASRRFQDFGFGLVDEALYLMEAAGYLAGAGKNRQFFVLIGPHESLTAGAGVEIVSPQGRGDEYRDFLNYRFLLVDGVPVLNFDYIFSDQSRNVLSQLYLDLNAKLKGVDVLRFHYGKYGILHPDYEIGDACIPDRARDEIVSGRVGVFDLHNRLTSPDLLKIFSDVVGVVPRIGTTVNSISVLRQTRESLERARDSDGDLKGHLIDMEQLAMEGISVAYKNSYPDLGRLYNFAAGVTSDKPLEGKNLGNTKYDRRMEQKVARAMIEIIRHISHKK